MTLHAASRMNTGRVDSQERARLSRARSVSPGLRRLSSRPSVLAGGLGSLSKLARKREYTDQEFRQRCIFQIVHRRRYARHTRDSRCPYPVGTLLGVIPRRDPVGGKERHRGTEAGSALPEAHFLWLKLCNTIGTGLKRKKSTAPLVIAEIAVLQMGLAISLSFRASDYPFPLQSSSNRIAEFDQRK